MLTKMGSFIIFASLVLIPRMAQTESKNLITPQDCVTTRYLEGDGLNSAIQINHAGRRVAYLVRAPNLAENRNDIELHVLDLSPGASLKNKLLLIGAPISHIVWSSDDRYIFAIAKRSGGFADVVRVDSATGAVETLVHTDADIAEYTIDQTGNTVVFAIEDISADASRSSALGDSASGFRIPFERPEESPFFHRRLYVAKHLAANQWSFPASIRIISPFTGETVASFPYVLSMQLSLSPDGKQLAFSEIESHIPPSWRNSPFLDPKEDPTGLIQPLLLTDLSTGKTTLPLKTPSVGGIPLWNHEGSAFAVLAQDPVSSQWEREDVASERGRGNGSHLFFVSLSMGDVEQIASHVFGVAPLCWSDDGGILVHTDSNVFTRFKRYSNVWSAGETFSLPGDAYFRFAQIAGNNDILVGDFQSSRTPPELFLYSKHDGELRIVERLNPQYDHLSLAEAESVHWTTSSGFGIDGILFKPPQFREGVRYPLVIQTKPDNGWFVCDYGESHYPSFAPQPIADAGMFYLARAYPDTWNEKEEEANYPKGYPGQIAEAAFQADIWDRAVEALSKKGIVNPSRVGIIGFSRSGWYTEFSLVHGKTRYRAATVADNVEYSLSEYWLQHEPVLMQASDAMYEGSPYGAGLKNWFSYSISFNLDKLHTPLLLERMGYGEEYKNTQTPPIGLAVSFELFTGLSRQNKPVELYYYPTEMHQPDHPKARIASLQRNVDWFRFWLLGEERKDPEDKEQYERWRNLARLDEANNGNSAHPLN